MGPVVAVRSLARETEVPDLRHETRVQKNVSWLYVTVDKGRAFHRVEELKTSGIGHKV